MAFLFIGKGYHRHWLTGQITLQLSLVWIIYISIVIEKMVTQVDMDLFAPDHPAWSFDACWRTKRWQENRDAELGN